MIEEKGTLRQQMMRCYLYGYLIQRDYIKKLSAYNTEYDSYKSLKKQRAIEKIAEYGVRRKIAEIIISITPPIESLISILLLLLSFIKAIAVFIFTAKRNYTGSRFSPHLNCDEKRIVDLFKSAGYTPESITIIEIPGQYTKYERIPKVSVYSGITFSQLIRSFLYSMRMICFMQKKYGKDDFLFRSYSSFPYFLCFFFVSNLEKSNEVVFINHYDRWMYLFGNSHLHRIYIQHGKLWKDHIKRINCDVAYYINRSQQSILEYTLFSNIPEAKFRKVFDYSGLDRLKKNGNKDLLVICEYYFAEYHERIVKQLYDQNVNIYLKPHPGDNLDLYTSFQKTYPEIVILGKFDYPKVDVVVSYDSTLADEYEMHDIPVLRYDDSDFNNQLQLLLES